MNPRLSKIWLEEIEGEKALRADFSNDRNHRVIIKKPHEVEQLAQALVKLAHQINNDQNLRPNAKVTRP